MIRFFFSFFTSSSFAVSKGDDDDEYVDDDDGGDGDVCDDTPFESFIIITYFMENDLYMVKWVKNG